MLMTFHIMSRPYCRGSWLSPRLKKCCIRWSSCQSRLSHHMSVCSVDRLVTLPCHSCHYVMCHWSGCFSCKSV